MLLVREGFGSIMVAFVDLGEEVDRFLTVSGSILASSFAGSVGEGWGGSWGDGCGEG